MNNKGLAQHESYDEPALEGIYKSLHAIQLQMENEMAYKQKTIESSAEEIRLLKALLVEKENVIAGLNNKIAEINRANEGNRQINKKLINEVVRKQQDIEWYKRTYESRSLLGTIKEKIFGKGF